MIKRTLIFCCFMLTYSCSTSALAQFINLELKIEPELSATVEQSLNFGTQVTNSGATKINLGDLSMGIFSIRAFSNQKIHVALTYPDHLINNNPKLEDQIPLELAISYNNSGNNSYQNSTVLNDNTGSIQISKGLNISKEMW